eukprot:CAMPEP_0180391164 /NCGR_PEP_ID=MMETSP0989-20121125/32430_1 /TAXON_ID=697907 /ORGANISM="non described non described, Strain CCMP2293" /LENGTH=100 /DNA_ID=CAMNT_0022392683 /DNA_START=178 /DNA_END=481 /DNA_ORIENTATION=+
MELHDVESDNVTHAPDLSLHTLAEDHAQHRRPDLPPVLCPRKKGGITALRDRNIRGLQSLDRAAAASAPTPNPDELDLGGPVAAHAHQVLLLHFRVFANN